ncbi:hypothetical protein BH20ACT17_BH20ACT17_10130 [soil metagenome]
MPRRLFVMLLVAASLFALPAPAAAKVNIALGIGDQHATMFGSPFYKDLKLRKTRYFIEWNAINQPDEIAKADQFVAAAKVNRVKVLMHISTDNINAVPRSPLPSVRKYRQKVKSLIRRYKRHGVKDWGVWNEANHRSQPTTRSPRRAAQFFEQMHSLCRGCTIVALDVLDQAGVQRYINRWFVALGRSNARKVRIVGIHNYSEVNRRLKRGSGKYPGTRRIIEAARAHNRTVRFWYTETGGHVKLFGTCDIARAANRTVYMFSLAKRFRRYVRRLYTYNWTPATPACDDVTRFDSGIVNPDGSPRAAYWVIRSRLKGFTR